MSSQIPDYLQLRQDLQLLFPGIFLSIRSAVESELAEFGVRGVVGELDRATALARNPDAGLAAPYDWVAFGFAGYEFYDAHVGVVMDTSSWPCTCRVGFHRRSHLSADVHERIDDIDWTSAVGRAPEHELIEATGEHQLRDVRRPFDFDAIDAGLAHFTERACTYYRAAAAALGVLAEP